MKKIIFLLLICIHISCKKEDVRPLRCGALIFDYYTALDENNIRLELNGTEVFNSIIEKRKQVTIDSVWSNSTFYTSIEGRGKKRIKVTYCGEVVCDIENYKDKLWLNGELK